MKNNHEIALNITKNADRKTNCRKFYFSDDEIANYLESKFQDDDLLDIYKRSKDGEFVLIKEVCGEYNSLNIRCNYLELYITIGESTYLLYSQYNESCK